MAMPISQMQISDVELLELAARLRRMPLHHPRLAGDCDQAAALLEQLCLTAQPIKDARLLSNAERQMMNRAEQVLANHKRAMQCFRAFRAMREESRPGTFFKALADTWFLADGASKGRLSAAFPELIQEWSASAEAGSYVEGCIDERR